MQSAIKTGNAVPRRVLRLNLGSMGARPIAGLQVKVVLEKRALFPPLIHGERTADDSTCRDNNKYPIHPQNMGFDPRNCKFGAFPC